jgi:hypothetical protein
MPANSRLDLIQRLNGVKIPKNPRNVRLNNLNEPVLNVLRCEAKYYVCTEQEIKW